MDNTKDYRKKQALKENMKSMTSFMTRKPIVEDTYKLVATQLLWTSCLGQVVM